MTNLEMIDKIDQDLRFVEALFTVIEYAAEDQASCDAISEVSHWMGLRYMEDLRKFVDNEIARVVLQRPHPKGSKQGQIAVR
jgi:hypothetical protein